jgi:hypothetical protein
MRRDIYLNEAIQRRLVLAQDIAPAYSQDPRVQAVTVTGSVARGWADHYSGLEIDIFWQEFPAEAERQAILASLGQNSLVSHPSRQEGWSQEGYIGGIKIELSQFLVETIECCLTDVVEHYDADPDKQILMASIQHSLPLYGDALVKGWQAQMAPYPAELAQAVVKQNLRFNGSWSIRDVLVERDDLLLLYDLYCQVERQLLGILFGLNRCYLPHPSGKWLERLTQEMEILPPSLAVRLKQVFRLAPRSGVRLLEALIDETLSLVESHMPEVDTAPVRQTVQNKKTSY